MITKFEFFLLETNITDKIWHRTSTNALFSMLESGKILLSSSMGGSADVYSKKPYFLSLSRTKNLKMGYGKGLNVAIEFDGRSLKTKYKGKSIDYWQWPNLTDVRRSESDEYEDRIFSNEPFLNLEKYIVNIDILIPENWNMDWINSVKRDLKKISKMNSSLVDKIRIFTKTNDFTYGKNGIKVKDYEHEQMPEKEDLYDSRTRFEYRLLTDIITVLLIGDNNLIKRGEMNKEDREYIKKFILKYFKMFIDKGAKNLENYTDEEINTLAYKIQQQIYWTDREFISYLKSEIHNLTKSSAKTHLNYEVLKLLSDEMVKFNVNSLDDLIAKKKGERKSTNIDYSKQWVVVYDRRNDEKEYVIKPESKAWSSFNWTTLPQKDKDIIFDTANKFNKGYDLTDDVMINAFFNNYDEETAKKILSSLLEDNLIIVNIKDKMVYKEITEKDYAGRDIGNKNCWWYLDNGDWMLFIQKNVSEHIFNKIYSKIRKMCEDKEVKLRFIWAITEKLLGEEKTKEFFDENNLIPLVENGRIGKYILNIGKDYIKNTSKKEKEVQHAN